MQRSTRTLNQLGEPVDTWEDLATKRAQVFPVSGDERFGGEQWVAKEQVEFRIRWDQALVNLSTLDRIIYPIGEVTPANTYDVMAALELGRHIGVRIMAARRADVAVT